MGWRYRKSISILPGVKVNFNTNSTSLTLGKRGFHTTYSSTGRVTRSFGIPGTGLYYVDTVKSGNNTNNSSPIRNSRTSQYSSFANRENGTSENPIIQRTVQETQLKELRKSTIDAALDNIRGMYVKADKTIDWNHILISDNNDIHLDGWDYYKERVDDVLDGDIDMYYELINNLNPFDDLQSFGSEFSCWTADARRMCVRFTVEPNILFSQVGDILLREQKNSLMRDFVCAASIRVARDLFALLPINETIVTAFYQDKSIVSASFDAQTFQVLNFANDNPFHIVASFDNAIDFSAERGFRTIQPLDERYT